MFSRLAIYLRTGAIVVVGSHVGVTLASLAYATGRWGGANAQLLLVDDKDNDNKNDNNAGKKLCQETAEARHFAYVTEFVTNMYAGRGVVPHPHVRWASDVTFADPAAICVGPHEVQEAFRALRWLRPESMQPPRCIQVEPKGATLCLAYSLYQRYSLGNWRLVTLPSLLVVHVQLQQRQDMPQSDFVIHEMQEQWNAVPLLTTFLNKLARRVNGMMSYQFTKFFLTSTNE